MRFGLVKATQTMYFPGVLAVSLCSGHQGDAKANILYLSGDVAIILCRSKILNGADLAEASFSVVEKGGLGPRRASVSCILIGPCFCVVRICLTHDIVIFCYRMCFNPCHGKGRIVVS
jgi:hypothetical protein